MVSAKTDSRQRSSGLKDGFSDGKPDYCFSLSLLYLYNKMEEKQEIMTIHPTTQVKFGD